MAFSLRNLSVLAYANGFTLWHYKTNGDGLATTAQKGFFAAAGDLMAPGDMVMLTGDEGGSIASVTGQGRQLALAPLC